MLICGVVDWMMLNHAFLISEGMSDPELRLVLELATDEELLEFEEILYGTRFDCPLIFLMLFGLFSSDIAASVGLSVSILGP